MTRPKATAAEERAQNQLFAHLLLQGTPAALIPRDIHDSPDLAFSLRRKVVACECVQIPGADILNLLNLRNSRFFKNDGKMRVMTIVWPIEIHSWVKEAIRSKAKKADSYRAAVSADEVWLFVSTISDEQLESIYNENTVAGACFGAQLARHGFDRIYFYDVRCGVQEIFPSPLGALSIQHDLEPGYPAVEHHLTGGVSFTTTAGENEKPIVYEYELSETTEFIVPPIDPAFKKRGKPARRRRLLRKVIVTAFHDRAEEQLIWDTGDDPTRPGPDTPQFRGIVSEHPGVPKPNDARFYSGTPV